MRALSDLGVEQREARVRLQLPSTDDAAGVRIPQAAGTLRSSACRAHRDAPALREPAMADDGRRTAGSADPRDGSEGAYRHGDGGSRGGGCPHCVITTTSGLGAAYQVSTHG